MQILSFAYLAESWGGTSPGLDPKIFDQTTVYNPHMDKETGL